MHYRLSSGSSLLNLSKSPFRTPEDNHYPAYHALGASIFSIALFCLSAFGPPVGDFTSWDADFGIWDARPMDTT